MKRIHRIIAYILLASIVAVLWTVLTATSSIRPGSKSWWSWRRFVYTKPWPRHYPCNIPLDSSKTKAFRIAIVSLNVAGDPSLKGASRPQVYWSSKATDQVRAFSLSKSIYAARHRYLLLPYAHSWDTTRNVNWSKVKILQSLFGSGNGTEPRGEEESSVPPTIFPTRQDQLNLAHGLDIDWVWVVDHDIMIFDLDRGLEGIIADAEAQHPNERIDLIITADDVGLNCGSVLIRKSAWSLAMLRTWNGLGQLDGEGQYVWAPYIPYIALFHEQAALQYLLNPASYDAMPTLRNVAVIPNRWLTGYATNHTRANTHFLPGDFSIHFPGRSGDYISFYSERWEEMMSYCYPNTV